MRGARVLHEEFLTKAQGKPMIYEFDAFEIDTDKVELRGSGSFRVKQRRSRRASSWTSLVSSVMRRMVTPGGRFVQRVANAGTVCRRAGG